MRLAILLCVLCLTACKSTPQPRGEGTDRTLFGDDPLTADWQEWTPQQTASTPQQLTEKSTAFDYWQVIDERQREEAWAAIFGVLSEVRQVAPRQYDTTFRMLMTVLEPGGVDGVEQLDATFFAARPGTAPMFEGVGWRLWRELPSGATPSVTVWMRRYEADPEYPAEAYIWFYGGFEESESMTLHLDGSQNWAMRVARGIGTSPTTPIEGESQLLRGILIATFWEPIIGPQYLETAMAKREETVATPGQQPTAMGLALGDRDIDQVFSDSVFAPRLTLFPAKQRE